MLLSFVMKCKPYYIGYFKLPEPNKGIRKELVPNLLTAAALVVLLRCGLGSVDFLSVPVTTLPAVGSGGGGVGLGSGSGGGGDGLPMHIIKQLLYYDLWG